MFVYKYSGWIGEIIIFFTIASCLFEFFPDSQSCFLSFYHRLPFITVPYGINFKWRDQSYVFVGLRSVKPNETILDVVIV
jgi:hypothetical protein